MCGCAGGRKESFKDDAARHRTRKLSVDASAGVSETKMRQIVMHATRELTAHRLQTTNALLYLCVKLFYVRWRGAPHQQCGGAREGCVDLLRIPARIERQRG
jgi:hypothetical protein